MSLQRRLGPSVRPRYLNRIRRPVHTVTQYTYTYYQRCEHFTKIYGPPAVSRRQKGEMKQVSYWGPKGMKRHDRKFGRHGELAPGVCSLLLNIHFN